MDQTQTVKRLTEKMVDYKRFAFTLIALSVFLYLGVVLPIDGRTDIKTYILMIGNILLLALSVIFFLASFMYKKRIQQFEENE
ncbi:hypothetical protein J2S13_003197 [Oikeobacillus pervagus]|uniref:YrhC-like protein n=1 Tax=Oikeobacillus pervagus TaxID=1325931 RepID=A0AAJ1T188_9BACI|nr:YrhC family protein [Oikeobacillus pervagus]MDQ0216713.1 hypothetical protein [Oikeobacillus pervagus]